MLIFKFAISFLQKNFLLTYNFFHTWAWTVSDSIKRSWDESIYSQSFGTMVRISRKCKEDPFSCRRLLWLLCTVAVSNPRLERMFPRWKRVKSNFRCPIGIKRLENILRIMEEGSSWETYDSISAAKKWSIDKVRRTTEEKWSSSYKSHNFGFKWMLSLSVMLRVTMTKRVFRKMETKKGILFLLVPSKIIIFFLFLLAKWEVHNYVMLH